MAYTKTDMKEILLWLWQLPQHLLGLLLILFLKAGKRAWPHKAMNNYWLFERNGRFSKFFSGGSFGRYIILPPRKDMFFTVPHEYGHSIQSLYLGWLYLPVVGIYSAVFCNLWDRLFHKNWPSHDRQYWYYNRWTERWADKLGGVDRDKALLEGANNERQH